MHIDGTELTNHLLKYRETLDTRHLDEIYKGLLVLNAHTLDKILRKSGVYRPDRTEIIHDAATRLIIRIIKRPEYFIPSHNWMSKVYYEVIKQLWSPERIKWDRLQSLD